MFEAVEGPSTFSVVLSQRRLGPLRNCGRRTAELLPFDAPDLEYRAGLTGSDSASIWLASNAGEPGCVLQTYHYPKGQPGPNEGQNP